MMGQRLNNATSDPHVLLVTASEGRRLQLARLLRRSGYQVQRAASAREALHTLAFEDRGGIWQPDLVIVDQESLGTPAEQVVWALRKAEITASVVVLSRFGAEDDTIACLRAGADDYINLPAASHEVLDVLGRALRHGTVL